MAKEAQARIKINKLLEDAGWRFFDADKKQANISLEHRTKKVKLSDKDLGDNFEKAPDGFIDYLLLNDAKKPIALVEAKRENIDPLNAKEQAREYALAKGIFHIFLSNGNVHYYWDLREGNPIPMSRFYSLNDLDAAFKWQPNPQNMKDIVLDEHYIAVSMDSRWLSYSPEQRQEAAANKGIRTLRYYQLKAAQKVQSEYLKGKKRFLFEMATGTGKTLTSAAIIKMFIRSDNANRVLFLVDRIELEIQARDDLGLLEKTLHEQLVIANARFEHLDRYGSIQNSILAFPDCAHTSLSQQIEDSVAGR